MQRYVCIHGHFYQPPRENPWLEEIELQESAYPFHDWNERINAECYAANAVSRILDDDGRIQRIVNNYAGISFNFGPTLLAWMKEKARETYDRILEADAQSRERFSGHGSALAQAYNHMILPLANELDKLTQVKWGIADFKHHFGRDPEGMWLPETAVDIPTLEALAANGIRFTILAPRQAARTRPFGDKHWRDVQDHHVDATMPYLQKLPSGREIAIFFYDGPTSQAVAFEELLASGETFAARLAGAFPEETDRPHLVNIATDGESYGHHHRHGDMALAYALHELEENPAIELTNYAEFLEKNPPTHEVQIIEKSSWSCAHGVGRWERNCGCNSGGKPGWTQAWREPLRLGLDKLRDAITPHFKQAAAELFKDAWAARDAYIGVILDRSPEQVDAYFREHAAHELSMDERVRALKLMELQRNLMLMYTSCGWFFDELSGIETVQVIHYAGRAVQLAEELFDDAAFEEAFLANIEHAKSNVREHGNGRAIYLRWVKPAIVGFPTVGGHYAVSSLFEEEEERDRVFCYDVQTEDYHRFIVGRSKLLVGRVRITSRITLDSELLTFSALHLGDHNLLGSVRPFRGEEQYEKLLEEAREAFTTADVPETIRCMDRHFGDHRFTIASLFRDDQRRILDLLLDETLAGIEQTYRRVFEDNIALMQSLASLGARPEVLPTILRTTAEFILNLDLRRAFESDEVDIERIREVFDSTALCGLALDTEGLSFTLQRVMERAAEHVAEHPDDLAAIERLDRLAEVARSLPFEVDLWKTQNVYFSVRETAPGVMVEVAPGAGDGTPDGAAREWLERFRSLGEKLMVGGG